MGFKRTWPSFKSDLVLSQIFYLPYLSYFLPLNTLHRVAVMIKLPDRYIYKGTTMMPRT